MKKTLLLSGKLLIIFSMLWPMPFGFILDFKEYAFGEWPYKYWLPLLVVMAFGILLCCIGNYINTDPGKPNKLQTGHILISYYFKTIKWSLAVIGVLYLIGGILVGLWHLFRICGWDFAMALFCLGVPVGVAVYYGWQVYNEHKAKRK